MLICYKDLSKKGNFLEPPLVGRSGGVYYPQMPVAKAITTAAKPSMRTVV